MLDENRTGAYAAYHVALHYARVADTRRYRRLFGGQTTVLNSGGRGYRSFVLTRYLEDWSVSRFNSARINLEWIDVG